MNILCIIPARMGSSRFPGKPLAPLLGKPMIGHVYERVSRCRSLTTTVVATCDSEIEAYVSSIGGRDAYSIAFSRRSWRSIGHYI